MPVGGAEWSDQLDPETWAKAAYALSHAGDPVKGEALFRDANRLLCSQCHLIYGREINRGGPNMFGVGDKYSLEDLILAVERPSDSILAGFETVELETLDGEQHTGTLKWVRNEAYVLTLGSGDEVSVPFAEVAVRRERDLSLMPEGLTQGLTREEYADLFAFLSSLKTDLSDGLKGRDESARIRQLADPVKLVPFIEGLVAPVWLSPLPQREDEFVALQHDAGKVWRVVKQDGQYQTELFLDLGASVEMAADGLVGIAFHPNYHYNRRYFLKYGTRDASGLKVVIEERVASSQYLKDSGMAPRHLLEVRQPARNHNGGCLLFGPDGYLYAAYGDGGPQRDPNGFSQDLSDLKGAMIRIDVDSRYRDLPYGIPPDNPFVTLAEDDLTVRPEIWAYGFREPWRFSFDSVKGDLWFGDVGQARYEEVGIARRGENHGWNVIEAFHDFSDEYRRPDERYAPPVFAFSHKLGTSVTGGYVYRGDKESDLYGYYIFGDHESRRLFAVKATGSSLEEVWEIGYAPQRITAFAETNDGALLVVGYQGTVYRMALDRLRLRER